mmetsp:Transcript_4985/g.15706  ORF Transcript_4985/g.15706 Transcript_4985/m.15706 type:complete len:99 (+) Transcript_4985:8419-8715(+)
MRVLLLIRYIYRVNQYKGTTSDTLLASGAMVTFYSEDFQVHSTNALLINVCNNAVHFCIDSECFLSEQQKFNIGVDGYVEGINWFVFYIDGTDMSVRG